ncbi:hypothetical protein [Kutzneria sp. 744]|uniref:PH-like domain-containing protein n=1 Tax=Kutzneria sp. (strain 744) TaxID=345341 RepID=UPI0003EEDFFD|nr:hypothetical protein [Kutzneria sp. 744]EWM11732.1 integral membrane protein [Kutzneria sp. 744]
MTRLVLVLIVVAFFVLCAAAMWWGWRNKARRQATTLPAFPAAPSELGGELLPEQSGVYVSTTLDDSWQNRVAVGDVGFRSEATLHLHDKGLLIDRVGATPVWIPRETVRDARVGQGLAGKVMFGDGLLIIRWQVSDQLLDSGFRADEKEHYQEWVTALRSMAGVGGGAQ